jgi:hypothetical protein
MKALCYQCCTKLQGRDYIFTYYGPR